MKKKNSSDIMNTLLNWVFIIGSLCYIIYSVSYLIWHMSPMDLELQKSCTAIMDGKPIPQADKLCLNGKVFVSFDYLVATGAYFRVGDKP